jgi:hypothetical protein
MIERRRRFFRGDSLLDMPIFPRFLQFLSIACVFQSATGIIIFSQVVIATSTDAERLMDYVEGFPVATGQTQIKFHFSIVAASSDRHPVPGNLSAGAQRPGKRGLFRRGLFLVHGGSFSTRARRNLSGLGLYAARRNNTDHV